MDYYITMDMGTISSGIEAFEVQVHRNKQTKTLSESAAKQRHFAIYNAYFYQRETQGGLEDP